ncbi:MAG: hypothetical protein KDD36_07635 [Flavobacteriales bacterium]|nr:hypothetical protein [Flavobacteriales bacterium]
MLFTYDSQDSQTLRFFDFVIPNNWYEFSIRLKESSGPVHPYTIACNDIAVRRGELPRLSNEVVILHDSFSPTGIFSSGADMFAEEGWMYNRQGKAIWFGPELEKHQACNDDKVGKIKLFRPDDSPFYIFESYTP